MGKDSVIQITLRSATVNLEKCLAGKDRGVFLLLILLQRRGVKCALRVDFFQVLFGSLVPLFCWLSECRENKARGTAARGLPAVQ